MTVDRATWEALSPDLDRWQQTTSMTFSPTWRWRGPTSVGVYKAWIRSASADTWIPCGFFTSCAIRSLTAVFALTRGAA